MVFHVYVETIAIAQVATSTPIPHMRIKRLLSQVDNFFLLEATKGHNT